MKYTILAIAVTLISQNMVALDLALNWKPEPQFGGFYQAQIDKEFEHHGLNVRILEGGSGTPTVQMLANSTVDFAIVSAEEILTNNERNPDHQVIALFASFQTNPQILMCRAESNIKSVAEIFSSDVTLAWQNGLSYAAFLKKKYPLQKTKFVPYLGGISPYLADSRFCQQGFATSEPLMAEQAGHPARVFLVADEGFNPYTTVLATTVSYWKKNPKQVQEMVKSVKSGWEHYLKNPEAANQFMNSLNKSMTLATFNKSAEAQKKLIQADAKIPVGQMSLQRWSELHSQLKQIGILHRDLIPKDQFL